MQSYAKLELTRDGDILYMGYAMNQQEFLRDAMKKLGMTRSQFAARLNGNDRTLDKWLLPDNSNDFREMAPSMWAFINEIINHETLKQQYEKMP